MSAAGGGTPQIPLLLEAGDAFTGHPAPSLTALSHPPHAGAGSDEAALKVLGRTGVKPEAREWRDPAGARDNWSVAEIGERHLLQGEQVGRFTSVRGAVGGPRSSVKWRSELPVTGRTTTARERGVQAMSGQLRISSAPHGDFRPQGRDRVNRRCPGSCAPRSLNGARCKRSWRDGICPTGRTPGCASAPLVELARAKERSDWRRSSRQGTSESTVVR